MLNEQRLNFEDAPHGSAILFKIFRMLRTGTRCSSTFSGCSARERDILLSFQNAPHGSTILNDEVDEGSTKAILADYPGTPLKTALLNEEDDLEWSTPVVNQYIFRRFNRSIFE